MNLGFVRTAVMNVAAASGIVSFASFAYATYKDVKIQQVTFNQSWQQSEIYGIVFEGSPAGVKFPAIHEELNRRLDRVRQPLGLSLEEATTESVRAALIGLTERGIIQLRADHTYAVPMAPAPQVLTDPAPAPMNDNAAARLGATGG